MGFIYYNNNELDGPHDSLAENHQFWIRKSDGLEQAVANPETDDAQLAEDVAGRLCVVSDSARASASEQAERYRIASKIKDLKIRINRARGMNTQTQYYENYLYHKKIPILQRKR